MRHGLALTVALLLGCDANVGSLYGQETGDSTGNSGDGDGDGDGDPGEVRACIGGALCPEGRDCSNGVCLLECSKDEDCSGDDYCGKDNLCHSTRIPTCMQDLDCEVTQVCRNQICTTEASCDPLNYLADGCASNAICIEDLDTEGEANCYQMPACDPGGTCPIGLEGAVCNVDYLPSKDLICLIGLCDTSANCPAQWSCVRWDNDVLGTCSSGAFGSPCSDNGHCISDVCVPLPGVDGGFCQ